MNDEYRSFYRILGVEPGCSWTELKLAYRRLVRRWHPDHQKSETGTADDTQIKAVNTAFEALSSYYQRHGELPFATPESSTKIEDGSETTAVNSPPGFATSSPTRSYARTNRGNRLRYVVIGAALAIVYTIFTKLFVGEEPNTMPDYTPPSKHNSNPSLPATTSSNPEPNSASHSSVRSVTYFTPGSTIGEVIAAQGPPTQMEKGAWHYGKSRVYFRDGHVTHWEEDEANPLNARLFRTTSAPSVATVFGVGSTKSDVRAAQGSPMLETDTMWDYGASRVYFKDGKVTGWEESPIRPLHLRH